MFNLSQLGSKKKNGYCVW